MRIIPSAMQDHLDGGATTLCWCWKVMRGDDEILGFTDHDNDLSFDGVTYEAASGFSATDARQAIGLSVDDLDVEGALQSERIAYDDLARGVYDDARINLFRVNWSDVTQRVLIRSGTLGEVTRTEHGFRAEMRGLSHYLSQEQGRLYQNSCDADLGDSRCGVVLDDPARTVPATVAEVMSRSSFTALGLEAFPSGWFSFGLVRWSDGANSGQPVQVKSHHLIGDVGVNGGIASVSVWEPMRGAIVPGDAFDITVGCDKQVSTCADKFSNVVNFRGFPHIPGTDYVTHYLNSDDPK